MTNPPPIQVISQPSTGCGPCTYEWTGPETGWVPKWLPDCPVHGELLKTFLSLLRHHMETETDSHQAILTVINLVQLAGGTVTLPASMVEDTMLDTALLGAEEHPDGSLTLTYPTAPRPVPGG